MAKLVKYVTTEANEPLGLPITPQEWFQLWTDYSAASTSSWFKSLPSFTSTSFNKAVDRVNDMIRGVPPDQLGTHSATIKRCPNVVEYLSRCLVIKSPCDIDFALTDAKYYNLVLHDKVFTTVFSESRMPVTDTHPPMQYTSKESSMFKDHVNLKLHTGIHLVCPKDINPVFQQPFYHSPNAPFKVIPGVFKEPHKRYASLIWNVFIPVENESFSIKKGDALFYVYFNSRVKFKYDSNYRQSFFGAKFNKPLSLITDVLGEKHD